MQKLRDTSNMVFFEPPVGLLLCRILKRAQDFLREDERDLAFVRQEIKASKERIKQREQINDIDEACKRMHSATTVSAGLAIGALDKNSKKRKFDAFDEVAKHARTVLDLHKRIKTGE